MKKRQIITAIRLCYGVTLAATIRRCNLSAVLAVVLALLIGCTGIDLPNPVEMINKAPVTKSGSNELQVYGVLVSDDPTATSVGNSILLNGGNAADAASAMAFTMSVTFPSRAGLGGGGVCLAGGGSSGEIKVLDFLPPASRAKDKRIDRPSAVPTLVRGVAALHARYGQLPWRMVVTPARDLARDGAVLTKSFYEDLAEYAVPLFADPTTSAIFADGSGRAYTEGNRLRQIDLSTVLSTVSARGAGEFYSGPLARRFVEASLSAGGSLDPVELREYLPVWRDPVSVQIDDRVLYTPPPPATAGIVAIQMLQMVLVGRGDAGTPTASVGLIADVAKRSFIERAKWLGRDFEASAKVQRLLSSAYAREMMRSFSEESVKTVKNLVDRDRVPSELDAHVGFIVADGDGLTIACSLTMYHPFGTGRTTPGLGTLLAAAPGEKGRNALALGPVVITRASDNALRFAFTGSGGGSSATAMANVMIGALLGRENLERAVSRARIHYAVGRDEIIVEEREEKDGLVPRADTFGQKIRRLTKVGRVNAISCPAGLPAPEPTCNAVADPRGDGLATEVNFLKEVR